MAMALSPQSTARILADLSQKAAPSAAPRMDTDKLPWEDYNPGELPADLQQLYKDRAAAMKLARELENTFKAELNDRLHAAKLLPTDETMLVSFIFGKFRCVAVKTADVKQTNAKPTAQVFGFKRA